MGGILSVFLIMGILIWQGIKYAIADSQAKEMRKNGYTWEQYKEDKWNNWKKKNGF